MSERPYQVSLSDDALFVYLNIPSGRDFDAVDTTLNLLGEFPYYGRVYDPLYEAARLPFEVRVAFAGRYGIYYEVIEAQRLVAVHYIEDQRRDPTKRFSDTQSFYSRR